jgi:hypothetical protein
MNPGRWHVLLASAITVSACGSVAPSPMEAPSPLRVATAIGAAPDSRTSSPYGSGSCAERPSTVRFARDIEPIFISACSGEYCHGNRVNTPVEAYRFFVDQPSKECVGRTLVSAGRPDTSYLMEKVRGQNVCAGEPMPRGAGNSLRPDQIELLNDWICGGASFD